MDILISAWPSYYSNWRRLLVIDQVEAIREEIVELFDEHCKLMSLMRKHFQEQELDAMEDCWARLQKIKGQIERLADAQRDSV